MSDIQQELRKKYFNALLLLPLIVAVFILLVRNQL